jgi:hypothetical protein
VLVSPSKSLRHEVMMIPASRNKQKILCMRTYMAFKPQ